MKTTPASDWTFRLLNVAASLVTIFVFWAINVQYRFPYEASGRRDLIDLAAITAVTALACGIVWLTDQYGWGEGAGAKLGQSLILFLILTPLTGWLIYSTLFHIPVLQTSFLRIGLPLAIPVFIAWASTFLLRQRMRRIEAQQAGVWVRHAASDTFSATARKSA